MLEAAGYWQFHVIQLSHLCINIQSLFMEGLLCARPISRQQFFLPVFSLRKYINPAGPPLPAGPEVTVSVRPATCTSTSSQSHHVWLSEKMN